MSLLAQAASLLWGLQFAFLNPALALLLSNTLGASETQVGIVLAIFNASGFLASLVVPAFADRRGDYLGLMLLCGVFALALAGVLAVADSLLVASIALVVLGGPAGVGSSLFYAHLSIAGFDRAAMMGARAMVSVAWVAGPPLAMLVARVTGIRSVLVAIVAISLAGIGMIFMMRRQSSVTTPQNRLKDEPKARLPFARVSAVVVAFVSLKAANATTTTVMTLFVVNGLGLDVMWGGMALAVAALVEIPALLVLGRLSTRFGPVPLLVSGAVAGILFYGSIAFISSGLMLIVLQLLNAWFVASIVGVGLTWFLDIIPGPGLASGLFANTHRVGAIFSGGVIAIAGTSSGYTGMFLVCAALTAFSLVIIVLVGRGRSPRIGG